MPPPPPPAPPTDDVNTILLFESKAKKLAVVAVPKVNPVNLAVDAVIEVLTLRFAEPEMSPTTSMPPPRNEDTPTELRTALALPSASLT